MNQNRSVVDLDAKLKQYKEKGVKRVKLAITDVDGVLRGKYVSPRKICQSFKMAVDFAIVFWLGCRRHSL